MQGKILLIIQPRRTIQQFKMFVTVYLSTFINPNKMQSKDSKHIELCNVWDCEVECEKALFLGSFHLGVDLSANSA